jgi:hypothetical protein
MDITKQSQATNVWHTRDIPVDYAAYSAWMRGDDGRYVQEAFPHLSADDREFLLTGITPEEWDELYGDQDEDVESDYTGYPDPANQITREFTNEEF